jgi:SWI/SNF-related matrix-associated actin-dependent regulator of chromatin subfamily A member 5
MNHAWCDVCRGGPDSASDVLVRCSSCPRRFHTECCDAPKGAGTTRHSWVCDHCVEAAGQSEAERAAAKKQRRAVKRRVAAVRAEHRHLKARSKHYFQREQARLKPFVPAERLQSLLQSPDPAAATDDGASPAAPPPALSIGPSEPYINAELRSYQVLGVNWILRQYSLGVGGILADEMGLGKTIQTLSFLSALKAAGLPGPHLVVTPLAVLQNWHNEIKKFTPGLTVAKIQGYALPPPSRRPPRPPPPPHYAPAPPRCNAAAAVAGWTIGWARSDPRALPSHAAHVSVCLCHPGRVTSATASWGWRR